MDAFVRQCFQDIETIAGMNVIKLSEKDLLSIGFGRNLVGEILIN